MRRAVVAGLIGAACAASAHGQEPVSRRVVFQCHGGQTIMVLFGDATATLLVGREAARLERLPAQSGVHYRGNGHDLRGPSPGPGSHITWTAPDRVVRRCRQDPP